MISAVGHPFAVVWKKNSKRIEPLLIRTFSHLLDGCRPVSASLKAAALGRGANSVNEKYRIYHFFAKDPEGRTIEFQQFLHPIEHWNESGRLMSGGAE